MNVGVLVTYLSFPVASGLLVMVMRPGLLECLVVLGHHVLLKLLLAEVRGAVHETLRTFGEYLSK